MRVTTSLVASLLSCAAAPVFAQECCGPAPVVVQLYRLEYRPVYEERQVTAYRIENETVYDQRQITSYKPVWETQMRERRYTVAKPVYETSEREERYTVQKPVYETQIRDESYDVVRSIPETSEREERYVVQRPVMETSTREERYVVRKALYETSEREEAYTVMEPVTVCKPVQVDMGQYVTNYVAQPGPVRTRLNWQGAACVTDPATGMTAYQRGGLYWTPTQAPPTLVPQTTYVPNVVTQNVQETVMQPRTAVRKVPVQTVRYVDEEMIRQVPVQVCKIVNEEQVRRVPVTTYKQVVERVPKQVSVQVCKMINEEVVRKVPVTTMKMTYEERVEQNPVQVCKYEAVVETVQVPRCVEKRVPVVYTQRVCKYVCNRVPLDACGNPIQVMSPTTSSVILRDSQPAPSPPTYSGDNSATQQPSLPPGAGPVDEKKVNVNKEPTEAPPAKKDETTIELKPESTVTPPTK